MLRFLPALAWMFIVLPFLRAQPTRPFYMTATASQAAPGQVPLYTQNSSTFSLAQLSADVDVITVFPEHLGFPVDLFLASSIPQANHPWTVQITELANAAKATGKPIAVQLALTRDYMVSKAYESGGSLKLDRTWAPKCYDLSSPLGGFVGAAYVNYVRWITTTFNPRYLVVMAEVNLYYSGCGGNTAGWISLVNIERNAYDAAKLLNQNLIVFPSFKLEELYGNSPGGFDTVQYEAMANLKRDRFGISSYPSGLVLNPYLLPPDYLSRTHNRFPQEKRGVLAETGWNSKSISVFFNTSCITTLVYSEPSFTAAYLLHVLYYSYTNNFELVTWWSDRDLIPDAVMGKCYSPVPPQSSLCAGDSWCLSIAQFQSDYAAFWSPPQAEFVYKVFGSMGLRNYSGQAKQSVMDQWNQFRIMPLR